jgi:AraC family transcriptional regulator of arabinose operon
MVEPIVTGYFDRDKSYHTYRANGTQDWLLFCTVGGTGSIMSSGMTHFAAAGDIHMLPPGTLHDYGTASHADRWIFYFAHFVPMTHWSQWLLATDSRETLRHVRFEDAAPFNAITDAMNRAHRYASGAAIYGKELAMNALESVLIQCAASIQGDCRQIDPRIELCVDAIGKSLAEPWTLDRLAGLVHLSSSRFSHLFRTQMQMTPLRYVETRRIEAARQLLALTDLSLRDIAGEVGYDNAFYFSNRFKAVIGIAPSHYRQLSTLPIDPLSTSRTS